MAENITVPYAGALIYIGDWPVPNDYIRPESYDVSEDKKIISDYEDMTGHRHVIYSSVSIPAVSFETADNFRLKESDIEKFRTALKNAKQEDGTYKITYYSTEYGSYHTIYATLEPVKYSVWGVNEKTIFYNPATFSFKGMGG